MSTVIAAIDDDDAAAPVLAVAAIVAGVVEADVSAIHVRETEYDEHIQAAKAAEVPYRIVRGPVVASLTREASQPGVRAIVLGLRGRPGAGDPLGPVTADVARAVQVPVILVPPDTSLQFRLRRVLVPLKEDPATAASLATTIEDIRAADLEVIVVHVADAASIPAFQDQAQHETEAWAHEFVARYVPVTPKEVRFEWRVGDPAQQMMAVAAEAGVDLIALGWARDLGPGRATVVRRLMERSRVPLLLLPVSRQDLRTGQPARQNGNAGPDG
jgi:nucleotide-binding universal stress UspA family protein